MFVKNDSMLIVTNIWHYAINILEAPITRKSEAVPLHIGQSHYFLLMEHTLRYLLI